MRHLLSVIAVVVLGSIGWAIFADKCSRRSSEARLHDTPDEDTVMVVDVDESDDGTDEDFTYYGDTLYQYDGKTLIIDYSDEDDELSSMSASKIMTYVGTTPVDSCRVIGNGTYFADGSTLKFAIGVDTVRYNMRNLPDSVDPARELLPPGVVEHRFFRSFSLSDSSWNCDFKFHAFLPKGHPAWLNQFIAVIMRNDIQAMYLDNKGADRILKEYYGIKNQPKKIGGINAASMSPKQIAKHFASEHERLYRNDFDDGEETRGPKYDYMIEVAPAWSSPDGRYVTYRFYSYYYTAGAHGFMEEYYLTIDNNSGRLLGYEDIIGKKDFPKSIAELEKQLTAYRSTWSGNTDTYPAALDGESLEANSSEIIKEIYNGSYYPRPAITKRGIVFTYQPYEKGAFCDGILHFVQPFPKGAKIK